MTQSPTSPITIVSGLPRSGTSMMMRVLEAGGLPLLVDGQRNADEDNPKGYFEHELVKGLKEEKTDWLPEAAGKVVKVVSPLLELLPSNYEYRVLFMQRAIPEVLASQQKMLSNRGEDPSQVADAELARIYEAHLKAVIAWMNSASNLQFREFVFHEMIEQPEEYIARVQEFLPQTLDTEKMKAVIDPSLYRNRAAE